MLFWAMVMLTIDCVRRLLCWSLIVFIPLSVVHAWTVQSEMRWISTILAVALGMFLALTWSRLKPADRARASWLLVFLLVSLSVILGRTENDAGYSIFSQPTHRLHSIVMIASVLMTFVTLWRLADSRSPYVRAAIAVVAAYGLVAFVPGSLGSVRIDEVFTPSGFETALPWFLRPAGFSVALLLPIALISGIADSLKSVRRGDPLLLRERWFEFSCIILSIAGGAATLLRLHSPNG
jgi:hypothetical protein